MHNYPHWLVGKQSWVNTDEADYDAFVRDC